MAESPVPDDSPGWARYDERHVDGGARGVRVLTQDPANPKPVLRRSRDSQRVIDMIQLVDARAKSLGFGRRFEGRGLSS